MAEKTAQWMMWITVNHSQSFGHELTISVVGRVQEPHVVARWAWRGLGLPPGMITDISARCDSVVAEHLLTRYGEQMELPYESLTLRRSRDDDAAGSSR